MLNYNQGKQINLTVVQFLIQKIEYSMTFCLILELYLSERTTQTY